MPKSIALRVLILIAVLAVLQWFPYTGIFFLFFPVPWLTGLLVHVFFVALLVDVYLRRLPLSLVAVPVAAYGAYYVAYVQQGREIESKAAELRAANPGKLVDFDPTTQALVADNAKQFVRDHAIPIAYAPINPEGYYSYRLIRRDQCRLPRDSQSRVVVQAVHDRQACLLQFQEAPQGEIIKAVRSGDWNLWHAGPGIREQVTTIVAGGREIGSYRSAIAWRLPVFPTGFIGCTLIDASSNWECLADFDRTRVVLDTVPAGVDRTHYDTPLSIMLGLKTYTEADLADFRGYAINEPALARIAEEPARQAEAAFAALAEIIDGQDVTPPFRLGSTLARQPDRLAPLAEKIADRYVALERSALRKSTDATETIRALATALAALPADAFARIANRLHSVLHEREVWQRATALYVRAADAGPTTFPLYKKDFLFTRGPYHLLRLPVLAICRIGEADAETIAEMKRRISDDKRAINYMNYRTALFVTLMKLGQEPFLRKFLPDMPWQTRPWAKAVLEGKGETAVGPNNCSAWNQGGMNYSWPMSGPTLRSSGSKVVVKAP